MFKKVNTLYPQISVAAEQTLRGNEGVHPDVQHSRTVNPKDGI